MRHRRRRCRRRRRRRRAVRHPERGPPTSPCPGSLKPQTPLEQAHPQGSSPPSRVLTVDDDVDADDWCPERATLSPQPRPAPGSLPFSSAFRVPAGRMAARGVYRANGRCTAPQPDDHRNHQQPPDFHRGLKWSASHFAHNTGAQNVPLSRPCTTDHARPTTRGGVLHACTR